ncbi:MAG TPA: aminotransferase class I/II-fold pyridoxal phosphate-dependent enzyme [Magnetospirillaceae bacterium]
MSIGEPQHPAPPMVAEVLAREATGWGRYPPMAGTPAFRAAAAGWLTRRYGLPEGYVDPATMLLPLAGTREGLFLIVMVTCGERADGRPPAILLPNPFYQVYAGAAVLAGAEPIFVPGTAEGGFLPDFARVPQDVLERTALAFLCTPANPQGAVSTLDQLKEALTIARRHGFTLAVDECYSEIYLDAPPPGGLQAAQALGGGLDNLVVFHSLSKRSSVPGLRVGFVAGDPRVMAAFSRLRSYGGASVPFPMMAVGAALWQDETHVEANRALYRQKFDIAESLFKGRLGFYRPAGGFYLWLNVGNGEAAAAKLWREAGIRTLPGAYLARTEADGTNPGTPYVRVALVQDVETTRHALTRMAQIL